MAYKDLNNLDRSLVNDMIIESLKDPEVRQEYLDAIKANKPQGVSSSHITDKQVDAFQEILERQRDEWSERMNEIPLGLRRAYDNNGRDEINDLGAQSRMIRRYRDYMGSQINGTGRYQDDEDMIRLIDQLKSDEGLPLRSPQEGSLGVDAEKIAEAVAGMDIKLQEAGQVVAGLKDDALNEAVARSSDRQIT